MNKASISEYHATNSRDELLADNDGQYSTDGQVMYC